MPEFFPYADNVTVPAEFKAALEASSARSTNYGLAAKIIPLISNALTTIVAGVQLALDNSLENDKTIIDNVCVPFITAVSAICVLLTGIATLIQTSATTEVQTLTTEGISNGYFKGLNPSSAMITFLASDAPDKNVEEQKPALTDTQETFRHGVVAKAIQKQTPFADSANIPADYKADLASYSAKSASYALAAKLIPLLSAAVGGIIGALELALDNIFGNDKIYIDNTCVPFITSFGAVCLMLTSGASILQTNAAAEVQNLTTAGVSNGYFSGVNQPFKMVLFPPRSPTQAPLAIEQNKELTNEQETLRDGLVSRLTQQKHRSSISRTSRGMTDLGKRH